MLLARRRVEDLTPSKLTSSHRRLVIDASVLINILGTGCPDVIFQSLRRAFFIDEITLREVSVNPATGGSPKEVLAQLQAHGLLQVIHMDDLAYERFIGFTGAHSPDDLDDGEAATLAQAACGKYVAVIDERKAIRIASLLIPNISLLNSIDLLAAQDLLQLLGTDGVSTVVHLALRNARMRVPPSARKWISDLLGEKRAQECPSLGPLHLYRNQGTASQE